MKEIYNKLDFNNKFDHRFNSFEYPLMRLLKNLYRHPEKVEKPRKGLLQELDDIMKPIEEAGLAIRLELVHV